MADIFGEGPWREFQFRHFEEFLREPDERAFFAMGVSYVYHEAPRGKKYGADYPGIGRKIWSSLHYELHTLLCADGKPQGWVEEIVSGDIRNIAVGLVTVIATKLDVTLGVAIPAAALVVKHGLLDFCSTPSPAKPKLTTRELFEEKAKRRRQAIEVAKLQPAPKPPVKSTKSGNQKRTKRGKRPKS
jgi:hypothetical protein